MPKPTTSEAVAHAESGAQPGRLATRGAAAFAIGAAVGVLGGLIGLGGAEFRLPLLVGWFRYPIRLAVVINLLVSLVTVAVSLALRLRVQGLAPLLAHWPVAQNVLIGALLGSSAGAHLGTHLPERFLARTVAVVLALLGLLLIAHEWLLSQDPVTLSSAARLAVGLAAGLLIGMVSSLLGVAGGELIIPTLVLLFGLGIKIAGDISLMISIPTVGVGILRYRTQPVFREVHPQRRTVILMALGSIVGAGAGTRLLRYAPAPWLQVLLGVILLFSATRMVRATPQAQGRQPG